MSEAVTPTRLEEIVADHLLALSATGALTTTKFFKLGEGILAVLRAALEADPRLYEELGIAYDGRYLARSGARWQDEWSRDVDAWPARDDTEEKK